MIVWLGMAAYAADYAVTAPITVTTDAPFQTFTLPIGAYLGAHHADLRDLRVLDGAGAEVPYARAPSVADTELALPFFALHTADLAHVAVLRDAESRITEVVPPKNTHGHAAKATDPGPVRGYLVDAGPPDSARGHGRLVAVTLALAAADAGYQRVDVEASDDLETWTPVVTNAGLVRTRVGGHEVRRERIELPEVRQRYVRVVWPEKAAEISGARLSARYDPLARGLVWTAPVSATRTPDGDVLVLPHPLAAERLWVTLSGHNVLAPVVLSTWLDAAHGWTKHADVLVYQLEAEERDWTSDDLELPPVVQGVRLDPGAASLGDPPPQYAFGLHPDRIIFVASGQGPYTLAVGRDDAAAVALTPEALVPGYLTSTGPPIGLATVSLDVPIVPAADPPLPPVAPPARPWTLWAVLLTGVVVLGAMAASLIGRTRALSEPAPPG